MRSSAFDSHLNVFEAALELECQPTLDETIRQGLKVFVKHLEVTWALTIKIYDQEKFCSSHHHIFCEPTTFQAEAEKVAKRAVSAALKSNQTFPAILQHHDSNIYLINIPEYGIIAFCTQRTYSSDELMLIEMLTQKLSVSIQNSILHMATVHLMNTYHDFVEQTPELAFEVKPDGTIVYINKTGTELLGITQEAIAKGSVNITSLFAPEEKERVLKNFEKSKKEQIPFPREYSLVTKTGERKTVLIYTRQIVTRKKLAGIRGFAIDITERKILEKALLENKERVEMALIGSESGLWDWNITTGEVFINSRWATMLDYTLSELEPNIEQWKKLVHPDDMPKVWEKITDHLNGETLIYKCEHRLRTKKGTWKWVLDTGRVVERDIDGNPLRAIGTHVDISERKESEEQLRMNLKQQELISDISISLNSLSDFENNILKALKKVGEHLNVSRVYIFEDDASGMYTSNTYEWCNQGITPEKDNLQNISYNDIPSWKKILKKEGMLLSSDTSNLPPDLKVYTETENILSILEYPIYINEQYKGFIGFDECIQIRDWSKWDLEMLRTIAGIIANALERHRSEISLRKKDERFKGFFNLSHVGLAINLLDNGSFVDCNEALLEQLGYTKKELFSKSYFDITPIEYEPQELQQIEKLRAVGKYGPFAKEYIKKNGERYPVLLSGFLAKDEQGRDVIWSEIQDISIIKAKDLEIKQSEEKFRGLYENSPFSVVLAEINGNIIECNDSFVELTGYSKEDLYKKGFMGLLNEEDHKAGFQKLCSFFESGEKIEDFNLTLQAKNGTEIFVEINGFFTFNKQGRPVIWATVYDVTQDRLKQQQLIKSEEKFRNIFENSPIGITQSTPTGAFIDANESFLQMIGYSKSELLSLTFECLAPIGDYEKTKRWVKKQLDLNGRYKDKQVVLIHKDGTHKRFIIHGFLDQTNDNKGTTWTSFTDITEQAKKQEELRFSEERFRQLFELYPYGITITTLDGELVDCNESLALMTGISKEDIKKRSPQTKEQKRAYMEEHANEMKALLQTGRYGPLDYEIKTLEGRQISCQIQGFSFKDRDGSVRICTSIQDISKEKERNEAIRLSEEKFRGLFELSPIGITQNDPDTLEFLQYNNAFLSMIGYTTEEFKEISYRAITPYEYIRKESEIAQSLDKKKQYGPFEKEFIAKDGHLIPVLLTGFLTQDSTGRDVVWSSIQDISELKNKSADLERSERKFRGLFERLPIGVVKSDLESFHYIEFNEAFREMLGYSKEELFQKSYWDITPKEEHDLTHKIYELTQLEGEFGPFEKNYIKANGDPIPVIINGYVDKDVNGRLVVWTTVQDISEIKLQEQRLRESEEKFRTLFERLPIGVVRTDYITSQYTECNEAFLNMLGYTLDELKNKTFRNLTPPTYNALDEQIKVDIAATGSFGPFEKEYIKKDGSPVPIVINGYLTTDNQKKPIVWTTVQDISILKENEKRLRQSEEKFRSFVENASDVILAISLQGDTIYVSPNVVKLLGYSQEEMIAQPMLNFVHPDDREYFLHSIKDYLVRGIPSENMEYRMRHKNDEWCWVQVTTSINRDSNNNLYGITILRDFTRYKKAKDELERLSLVASKTTNIIVITDKDGRIVWVNDAFTEHTGYSREEVIGRIPSTFLLGPQTNPKDKEHVRDGLRSHKPFSAEIYSYSKDGRGCWMEFYVTPIFDDSGSIHSYIAVVNDISNRKKAEEQIAKLSKGIDNSPTAVVITDREGIIEYVNNRFVYETGYTQQEAIGQTPRILKSGYHPPKFYEDLWNTIKSGKNWSGEIYNVKKDGTFYWESATITPIMNSNNEITHFIALKEDITERKQMYDEMLVALDKAEQATRAKSEFLATMSHEIRTPMNGVIGMTSLLSKTALTEEQLDYVNTIRNSGDALLTIINDILDFSKIESGRLELELHPFDIRQCVEDVVDLFWFKAYQKEINLTQYIDPRIKYMVLGDITRLRQILVNLVGNAIKFTERGDVHIHVELIGHRHKEKQSHIKFSVEDTGIGIPKAKQSSLFTAFSQVDASITRRFGGTGLGLAITSRLVELMGSKIGVESEENVGSNFFFDTKFTTTDLTYCTYNPKGFSNISVFVDTIKPQTQKWVNNLLDTVGLAVVNNKQKANLIFTDDCSLQCGPTNAVLITNIQENCTAQNFIGHLTTPLKIIPFVNLLNKVIQNKEKQVQEDEDKRGHDVLAHNYPISILVAEDNTINQKLMNKSLSFYGYTADIAGNGIEVLQALKRQHYDLIFMDLQMPEMDGLEATRQIIHLYKGNRPHIIAMTASALGADKDACLNAGMDDYVSKPIKIEVIEEMILKWCRDKFVSNPE